MKIIKKARITVAICDHIEICVFPVEEENIIKPNNADTNITPMDKGNQIVQKGRNCLVLR